MFHILRPVQILISFVWRHLRLQSHVTTLDGKVRPDLFNEKKKEWLGRVKFVQDMAFYE